MERETKQIFKGIGLAVVVVPFSVSLYEVASLFAYGDEIPIYWMINGVFLAILTLGFIVIYGVPVFLALRYYKLANWVTVVITALVPWIILDVFYIPDIHHFIEFSWYSLVSGFAFWYFARKSISNDSDNS